MRKKETLVGQTALKVADSIESENSDTILHHTPLVRQRMAMARPTITQGISKPRGGFEKREMNLLKDHEQLPQT